MKYFSKNFFQGWDFIQKEKFWLFIQEYLTKERIQNFEKVIAKRTNHFTLVIEDIYQEHNAGAVIRTAEALGIQSLHIIENRNKFKVLNSIAKGSEKWLDLYRYKEEQAEICIQNLKNQGYKIIATSPHTENTLQNYDIQQKTAFVLGAEKKGISETIKQEADDFIKIEMQGFVESFNISVAAAILLYETTQRLHKTLEENWQLSEEEKMEKRITWAMRSIQRAEYLLKYFLEKK